MGDVPNLSEQKTVINAVHLHAPVVLANILLLLQTKGTTKVTPFKTYRGGTASILITNGRVRFFPLETVVTG